MKKNQRNKDGDLDGYWESYYANGKLSSKGNYINGQKHGSCEWYWSNGNLMYKITYLNGKAHGYSEYHWPNNLQKLFNI
jgi:antitoxin component YwqK of YwqJK toxin-antitoxin module